MLEKDGLYKTIQDLDQATTEDVVKTLRQFYVEVRKIDCTLYAKKSLITFKFGLQTHVHFVETSMVETRNEHIINNARYQAANDLFKAMMVAIKKRREGQCQSQRAYLS